MGDMGNLRQEGSSSLEVADEPLRASVVVCTYSDERINLLQRAISSLELQTYGNRDVIVVADEGPGIPDALCSALPSDVRVVTNDRPGDQVRARNVGIQASTGDIVVFLDDDAVADANWLRRLMDHFRVEDIVAAGGRAVPVWEVGQRPSWFPEELDWIVGGTYRGYSESARAVRNLHGHNMAFRREILSRAGGFRIGRTGGDPSSCDGDEVELCIRIQAMLPGSLIFFDPNAFIYHKVPRAKTRLRYIIRKSYGQGRGKALIRAMHSSNPEVLSSEFQYVRHLFSNFVPRVTKRAFGGEFGLPLAQIAAVILSTSTTVVAYSISRISLALGRTRVPGRD